MNEPVKRWVYCVVIRHFPQNIYGRFLLTADDVGQAEKLVLESQGPGWSAHHSEMVCSTTDAPFFKEI
jgi:hypothetical protein